jgi:hypothetical protein
MGLVAQFLYPFQHFILLFLGCARLHHYDHPWLLSCSESIKAGECPFPGLPMIKLKTKKPGVDFSSTLGSLSDIICTLP